jgi:hypothetical protein
LFAYQSLDAIDGKQARRTGSSGPLGELFDHGKKALTQEKGKSSLYFSSMNRVRCDQYIVGCTDMGIIYLLGSKLVDGDVVSG